MAQESHREDRGQVSGSPSNGSGRGAPDAVADAADITQAYRDLARGEQAATALEANLSKLENKLDALLAGFEVASENPARSEEPADAQKQDEAQADARTRPEPEENGSDGNHQVNGTSSEQ